MPISSKFDHEMTLFFYPSPGILWHSPATLALSSGVSKLLKRPRAIGHVTIRVNSKGRTPSEDICFHVGMTQEIKEEGKKEVLFKGYGLGILFHDFKGRIEGTEELDKEVSELSHKEGRLSYIRYEINHEIAQRLEQYVKEFKAKGADLHYGGPHRPLYAEGGGCAAFAASFLSLSGLMNEEIEKAWTRTQLLPLSIVGGPRGKKKVNILKVLTTFQWAKATEAHDVYFTWDPDLMHKWTIKQYSKKSFQTENWNKALGLSIPAHNLVCPKGPIFLGGPDFSRMTREMTV